MAKDRTTILIGNGLGMALDPTYFSISAAMDDVWNNSTCLSAEQRNLILQCLDVQNAGDQPEEETDLYIMHLAANACEYLTSISTQNRTWLNNQGEQFPLATRSYLTEVAWYFHHHNNVLPDYFLSPLYEFISTNKTHIATLNYDNLMYQKFIEQGILSGYDGPLVDGFYNSGYNPDNLIRMFNRDFGYYLHLHGSPLFIEQNGTIIKQRQGYAQNIPTKHIVLTHFLHKPTVIDASTLLRSYWEFFNLALQETKELIIFGYSGLDTHLNSTIMAQANDINISIVEWEGENDFWLRTE
jgi:hypothetical protein